MIESIAHSQSDGVCSVVVWTCTAASGTGSLLFIDDGATEGQNAAG